MIVVGIDPGLGGSMVALDGDGNLLSHAECPVVKTVKTVKTAKTAKTVKTIKTAKKTKRTKTQRDFLPREMARAIGDICGSGIYGSGNVYFFLERAQAMAITVRGRRQGVSSSFTTGRGYGLWEGILAGFGAIYEIVTAHQWQKEMYRGIGGKGKDCSIIACQRLFPDLPVFGPRGGKRDGIADAALIAEYGRRRLNGK